MIRKILKIFNRKIIYVCEWGYYDSRYNSLDFHCCRPIHRDMGVAPPWAKLKIVKIKN